MKDLYHQWETLQNMLMCLQGILKSAITKQIEYPEESTIHF